MHWSPLVKLLPRFPASFCISRREVHDLKIHVSAVQWSLSRSPSGGGVPSHHEKGPLSRRVKEPSHLLSLFPGKSRIGQDWAPLVKLYPAKPRRPPRGLAVATPRLGYGQGSLRRARRRSTPFSCLKPELDDGKIMRIRQGLSSRSFVKSTLL